VRFYPTYDGNGNVSEYIGYNGSQAAHFEYDPFGNETVATSSSSNFKFRFATKPQDYGATSLTSKLYYYGYRWYDPLTGRWPSRDPIGENGGMNLYGFVGNDSVDWVDDLGHEIKHSHAEEIKRKEEERQKASLPPQIKPYEGPKELWVKKEGLAEATAYFGFVAAREALRLTLAPTQGKQPGAEMNRSQNLQKEHTGSICGKCVTCPNGEIRYHINFTSPHPQHFGITDKTGRDRNGKHPMICPEGYTAIGGYHSHPMRGATTMSPTEYDQPGHDNNRQPRSGNQFKVDQDPDDDWTSTNQAPGNGVPEFIGGLSAPGKLAVWRRPGTMLFELPKLPENEPCP
jgi:RHS repeat-associated protein